jgi:hypothetical protein
MRTDHVLAAICACLVAACSGAPRAPAGPSASPPVHAPAQSPDATAYDAFVSRFIEARMRRDPYFAVQAGRHEYDGQMPRWSRAALSEEEQELRQFEAALQAFDPAPLDERRRFERDYLLWVIDREQFWLTGAESPYRNPAWYLERLDPSMYLTREYAPLDQRMRGFLGYVRAIPTLAADIRANLRTPLPSAFIERGVSGFGGYARFFRDEVPPLFAQVGEGALRRELVAATAAAADAMEGLTQWLEAQRPHGTDRFALGAAKFSDMLRETERLEIPLDRLEQIGRADLERNLAALRDACAAFAPGAALAACVERMRANKPVGGSVEGARRQLEDLRRFVRERRIVSIPSEEQALVAESPPYNRGNFAYITTPGPYEHPAVKATYYVAPPDPDWTEAQRDAYLPGSAYLLFVSVHEVWPGHYLQGQFANLNPSKVGALWWNYSFGEGWAHYAEEMMYDAGLGGGDPELRVGMLANALLRDVRFISAICLHTGCLTLEESERMFREQAFADPGNARQQAVRGTYDPGYLAYTLGKLMIRKLRTDWLAANPGATQQQFHDRFLSFGVPPVPLVRRAMLGRADGVL